MKVLRLSDIVFIALVALFAFMLNSVSAFPINKKIAKYIRTAKGCNIVITSGHRSVPHNKRVGGVPNSLHLTNEAVDLATSKKCRQFLIKNAVQNGISVIVYKRHLHLDVREVPKCLVKTNKGYRKCRK